MRRGWRIDVGGFGGGRVGHISVGWISGFGGGRNWGEISMPSPLQGIDKEFARNLPRTYVA